MNDLVTRTGFRFSTRPATPADAEAVAAFFDYYMKAGRKN